MSVKRTEFLRALEIVRPGLANREVIDHSTSFAFMGDRVVTYNDEISISCPLAGLFLNGAVKADILYNLLGKLSEENVQISVTDTELLLRAGKTKAGLALVTEVRLPLDEVTTMDNWKDLPKGFTESVRFAIESCGHDMSRPILTCCYVQKDGIVIGSDSYRISKWILPDPMPIESFLLPKSAAKEMLKIKPDLIAFTERVLEKGKDPVMVWIHFKNKTTGVIISCRTLAGEEYPNTDFYFEMEGINLNIPEALNDVLDRAVTLAKQEHELDESVTIRLDNHKMVLESKTELGWFKETIENVQYEDEPIAFVVTPYLVKDIVSRASSCIMGEDRLRFEGESWVYIAALKSKIE